MLLPSGRVATYALTEKPRVASHFDEIAHAVEQMQALHIFIVLLHLRRKGPIRGWVVLLKHGHYAAVVTVHLRMSLLVILTKRLDPM